MDGKEVIINEYQKDIVFTDKTSGEIVIHHIMLLDTEHSELKTEMMGVKERIEQVMYGMRRTDHEDNLKRFQEIVLRLREIEAHPMFMKPPIFPTPPEPTPMPEIAVAQIDVEDESEELEEKQINKKKKSKREEVAE